jgi:tRNA pseudouridine55 synthase
VDGVLVVDKPRGLTSHDVVAAARRILKEKRIGHTGTLDPLATGVLALACGRATRLARFLSAADKDYVATIRFGMTTDTYDIAGTETGRSDRQPQRAELDEAMARLRGSYDQVPPAYSAKKVGGRRSYDLAREDQAVELRAVPVHVSRADVLTFTGDRVTVSITCSAGFYVRSFAHSLGEQTGAGACLEELRRTRSGEFRIDSAASLDELQDDPDQAASWMVPLESLLTGLPSVQLTEEGRLRVSHGREIEHQGAVAGPGAWVRLLDEQGRLIALGQPGATEGSLHPAVVLI